MTIVSSPTILPSSEDVDVRRIIWSMIIALILLFGGVGIAFLFFQAPLTRLSQYFVATLGAPGVALGYFLPDAFTFPLPNDTFTVFALVGGIGFWVIVFWGSFGSLIGGSVGFAIGRYLQNTRWFQILMAKRGQQIQRLMERYGVIALVIAAITPLPYSLGCWASGAAGMRFKIFFLVSLLRIPKVFLYLWVIERSLDTFG